jgi:superfamily II DNA/RNA helicase
MAPFPLLHQVVMSRTSHDKLNDLSDDFIKSLKPKERDIIIEAFLQTDYRSCGTQAPWPFQLECAVTLKTGQDLICTAGCGAGKTLAMALPVMMLNEGKIALTIVPLKLLQQNHVRNLVLMMSNRIPREDISLKLLASTASLHLCSTKIHHMILRYGRYVWFYLCIGFAE